MVLGLFPQDLTRFIDARVRLRGTAGRCYNQARQVRGAALFAGRTADAIIDTSAPPPWSLEVRAISTLFTHHAMDQLDRRVRLSGTVTETRVGEPTLVEDITMHSRSTEVRHRIYVRDATSAALIGTEQSIALSPGDVIDIAGFPVVSATNPMLKNAIIRLVGHVAAPAASALARETPLAATRDSELVTVNAVLLTEIATAAGRSLVLKIGDTVFEAEYDPRSKAVATGFGIGAVVSITGIYAFEPGPPPGFRVLLRSADDVVLLSAPPWWTFRHSLVLGLFAASPSWLAWCGERGTSTGPRASGSSTAPSSPSAAASPANCTIRLNRAWPAFSCSSVRSARRSTARPTRPGARWGSPRRCCATA